MSPRVSATITIAKHELQTVFDNLRGMGFTLVGPTIRDAAITLDEIERIDELPIGMTDDQQPGRYALRTTREANYFTFSVGPQSWKKFLFPAHSPLFKATRNNGAFTVESSESAPPRYAFVGARACDLSAIDLQDRVFMNQAYRDPAYVHRREQIFVLAVNCSKGGANCFCTSMKTGPRVTGPFDLALTELPDAFVIEIGSEAGSESMRDVEFSASTAFDLGRANQVVQQAERQITRDFNTENLPKVLLEGLEHPRWKDVGIRCLACANCTMVCPTCFCSTVEDTVELTNQVSERVRVWDSCYASSFSHVHGGNLRPTVRSRYRQWVTHKFASWKEQFGALGCVGCGRCITWCPVGIDVTEEIKAVRTMGVK